MRQKRSLGPGAVLADGLGGLLTLGLDAACGCCGLIWDLLVPVLDLLGAFLGFSGLVQGSQLVGRGLTQDFPLVDRGLAYD